MSTSAARMRKRPVAPKATTPAEVPATPAPAKAPFWSRAKAVVVKTAKHVVAFVKRTAKTAVAQAKPVARRAWTVALRPFLRGVAAGLALCGLVVGAFVAPLPTVLTLVVAAGTFFLLARFVKFLENNASMSRLARVTLTVLEILGRSIVAVIYFNAALATVALCSVSWAFSAYTALALVLAYLDVRGAGTIAFLAWCALSGAWALGILWMLWRGTAMFARREVPEYSEIRLPHEEHADILHRHVAKGAEEVADLVEPEAEWSETWKNDVHCAACGTDKGALRIRSNDVPFVTAGSGMGKPGRASTDMLCGACYDAECEDIAITMTGVSLKKRSLLVQLNEVGRTALPEVEKSKADPTNLYWAPTAWWRDRRGHMHERQWDCFAGGKSVATVIYDHQRRVHRASVLGQFKGTKATEAQAKRLASDTLLDEGNAVTRMTEALAEAADGAPLDLATVPA